MTFRTTLFFASLFTSTPVLAQDGSLQPGETRLRIFAEGIEHSPADLITLSVPITSEAPTAVAARSAATVKVSALTAALVAHGIDRSQITTEQGSPGFAGFVGNEAASDDDQPAEALVSSRIAMRGQADQRHAAITVKLRLRSRTQLDAATAAIDERNETMMPAPIASLIDKRPAQRIAIADAMAKAREQADDYASSAGLHVLRIVAISNAPAGSDLATFSQAMRQAQGSERSDQVDTSASVMVDYALGR